MKKLIVFLKRVQNRIFYCYMVSFHKDLFDDLNLHSWPRGAQLKQNLKELDSLGSKPSKVMGRQVK